jgi:heterodisulfide reductase subunit C
MNPNLAEQIYEETGADVRACYQCLKCSGGCPVAFAMDYPPSQVMRLIQFGQEERVLQCNTYWICASCQTCNVRCPNDIDIPHVMDNLKQRALKAGMKVPEPGLAAFHKAFLRSIKMFGRVFELGMIGEYKLRSRDFFGDLGMGMKMLARGKLGFLPHRIKDKKGLKKFFKAAKKRSKSDFAQS